MDQLRDGRWELTFPNGARLVVRDPVRDAAGPLRELGIDVDGCSFEMEPRRG
jgi:hypothetical protein